MSDPPQNAPLILVPARVYARLGDADVGFIERSSNGVICLYTDAVVASGGIPLIVPVPPVHLSASERSAILQPICDMLRDGTASGLMITGGADVSPKLYSEEPQHCGQIYEELDDLDFTLFRVAFELGVPILGICRGAQVINIALGGSCWQNMSPKLLAVHDNHGRARDAINHNIQVDPKSRFFGLLCNHGSDAIIGANSLHHQCLKQIGEGLKVAGYAEEGQCEAANTSDGSTEILSARTTENNSNIADIDKATLEFGPVPELIEHESKWVFGVQCHPEELFASNQNWRSLFGAFVQECYKARKTF